MRTLLLASVLTILALAAAGCSKQPCPTVPVKFEPFDNYAPYCEKLPCPACGLEFIPEIPGALLQTPDILANTAPY